MVTLKEALFDSHLRFARSGDVKYARDLCALIAQSIRKDGRVGHEQAEAFLIEALEKISQEGGDPVEAFLLKKPPHHPGNDFYTDYCIAKAVDDYRMRDGISLSAACRHVKAEKKLNKTEQAIAKLYRRMLPFSKRG